MKKYALVTGATGGIGDALCQVFERAGYEIIGLDIKPPETSRHTFFEVDLDVFCHEQKYRTDLLNKVQAALTGSGLRVLVNNAATQILKPTETLTSQDWKQTLNINVLAPFLLVQGLLPQLENAQGSVINISSVHASETKPEFVCYATSKAALNGLTRSLAIDLGARVRVNAICPAAVNTPMLRAGFEGNAQAFEQLAKVHPVGRIAEPEEIAHLALFLASEQAAFINGAAYSVDGGITARLHDPV